MSQEEVAGDARGVYAALATPRSQNSVTADAPALFDYVDAISGAGVDGFVLFGSTGEFLHFDIDERIRVLGLVKKRSRLPVLVNVAHSTLAGAVELAENALETGAAGLLLMPPYYFHYSVGEIAEFYRQFSKAVGAKARVYLYNIPQFTDAIAYETMHELLSSGAFAGIKDSSGNWAQCEKLLELKKQTPFQFMIGNDTIYTRARRLGADGIVSGVAAALPELIVNLNRALESNETARADEWDARLQEFLAWLGKFHAPLGVKIAASQRGWKLNHSAVPHDAATLEKRLEFEAWLTEWLPRCV